LVKYTKNTKERRPGKCHSVRSYANYVADCIHVSRSAIAGYEKKGRQPSHEKLTAIADLFEVPVDYLLNDEEDTITLSPSRLTTNSDDELNLLLAYRSLSRSSKRDLKKYMKLLKEKDASESS